MAAEIAFTGANNSTQMDLITTMANMVSGKQLTAEQKAALLKFILSDASTTAPALDLDGLKQLVDAIPIAEEGEVITPEYHNTIRAALLAVVDLLVQLDERIKITRTVLAKDTAISNAKRIGSALVMYTEDNDGQLPDSSKIVDQIEPYVKDTTAFAGFTYTYLGGPITNPAQTQLGYVEGQGGRAYIYADGHVSWVDQQSSATPTSGQGPG